MPLRTPRRRISPRTKRRCQAIKQFFRKTLGTLSNTDYKSNSSIIASVTDLKSKIDIIEQHLSKVSQRCRDLTCLEHGSQADISTNYNTRQDTPSKTTCDHAPIRTETKILYATPQTNYLESDKSQSSNKWVSNKSSMNISKNSPRACKSHYDESQTNKQYERHTRRKNRECIISSNNEINNGSLKRVPSSISLQSPREKYNLEGPCCSRHHPERRRNVKDYEDVDYVDKVKIKKEKRDNEHRKSHNKKYNNVDEEFIADIIRKQYKPVKLFGRRLSDYSQFSTPVCRDQEFATRDEHEEGSELCSCLYDGQRCLRRCRKYDDSDMRSICDARLYSAKRHRRYKEARAYDNYNDSLLYDLVPVKEKSSPKTRRKFIAENIEFARNREVLPSPRTHRPRLNLKAQRYAYDDSMLPERYYHKKPPSRARHTEDLSDSDVFQYNRKLIKQPMSPRDGGTITSLQCSNICNEATNRNNDTLNTEGTGSAADRTDRALCEIKDILQSFLQEIKKESVHSPSDIGSKSTKQSEPLLNDINNLNTTPKNEHPSFMEHVGSAPCAPPSFIPPFNPCCYPLFPMCPINYPPNNYLVPSPSFSCATCAQNSKETACHTKDATNTRVSSARDETQELIKEIYKCVAQNVNSPRGRRFGCETNRQMDGEKKILTSRSVGSSKASKHDAMVETPQMKCYSKSCEAIGSRMTTDVYYCTNPTVSDTVIEKLSLEMSSSSETELESKSEDKKISSVLRRLALFKRKKKDVIEEVSESESTVEVSVKPKTRAPYQQRVLNYNIHGQEYFHPPPDMRCCHSPHAPEVSPYDMCKCRRHHPQDHSTPEYYPPSHSRTPPPCCRCEREPYHHAAPVPQVPLCLKEIEVKSIGTQSERKLSIFPRFKKNATAPRLQVPSVTTKADASKDTNILFNWQKLKEKAKQSANSNSDPLKFSLKTQQQLAAGDMKMRNAMLKKLFYKRNPFSPRNLIVRTLMGKDKSSWGDPPRMYKPRMFI